MPSHTDRTKSSKSKKLLVQRIRTRYKDKEDRQNTMCTETSNRNIKNN